MAWCMRKRSARIGLARTAYSAVYQIPRALFSSSSAPFPPSPTASPSPPRICILGGGITGLSLAYFLSHPQALASSALPSIPASLPSITLIEKSPYLGGWIQTDSVQLPVPSSSTSSPTPVPNEQLLLERGPRSLQYRHGIHTLHLLSSLSLSSSIISADQSSKKRYLYDPSLPSPPKALLTPTGFNNSLFFFPYLSSVLSSIAHDLFTPKGDGRDESVYSFICRRFNRTIADNLIDPLLAGIYAGDPKKLSIHHCLSILADKERQSPSGSVVRGKLSSDNKAAAVPEEDTRLLNEQWVKQLKKDQIYSFVGGMGTLPKTIANKLKENSNVCIKQEEEVTKLQIENNKVYISSHSASVPSTSTSEYDYVYCTLPSHQAAKIFSSASLSSSLSSIPFASVYVVHLVYSSRVLPLKGFGILCSTLSKSNVLGITFDSDMFPSLSASPSHSPASSTTRLTVMIGGARRPELLLLSQEEIKQLAVDSVREILGIESKPSYIQCYKQEQCIPQYEVGHGEKVSVINKEIKDMNEKECNGERRLNVIGSSYSGVSLNDCIRIAKETATEYFKSYSN